MKQIKNFSLKLFIFLAVYTAAIIVPYWVGSISGGESHVFGGFLLNPLDGNSYLAKMQQGFEGNWRFKLPFTSQPGEGAYLFLFYLFLGHFSRWMGLSLVWTFHFWRVMSSIFLLFTLRKFFESIFPEDEESTWRAFVLASIGSGLGWIVFLFGEMTADFWVAEAYPFLSGYANPHFPLGLGLMLWILILSVDGRGGQWLTGLLALILGIVLPFGVVVACMVLGGLLAFDLLTHQKVNVLPLVWVTVFGGAMIAYQVAVTRLDTVFYNWNLQNLTPAPAWWDLLVSFLPALLAALAGILAVVKGMPRSKKSLLVIWFAGAIVLLCLPVNLQRRFMLGLYIPVAGLAVEGCRWISNKWRMSSGFLYKGLLVLSIPTNVVLLLAGVFGAITHNPAVYLTRSELQAMEWLAQQPGECLVVSSPQTGMYLPGHSGCQVMYGHPFETVNALEEEERVESFFGGQMTENEARQYLTENRIGYVFFGAREAGMGQPEVLRLLPPVYSKDETTIFAVELE